MGTMLLLTIISGVLLLLLIGSGVILRLTGEPYKMKILTVHKLISVSIIVLLAFVASKHLIFMDFGFTGWLWVVLTTVIILIAIGTGGLLTSDNTGKDFIKKIHRIASLLSIVMIPVIWLYCH